ncbi:ABC transporter ATP-binding protein [Paractinoplanes ferrugineus]|uniref:Dipeptide/oligopeptide/nickel ABC transporter ATP-binding protein n=1 Tax=Paractinoplanes ferrugineus TaxID=113564 RepID=A0A919MGF1_9ACTN|nr:ATP-binding cassette domain-containing protein [Actinoplanes ferrugineus]GIE13789.1 dipeptide/oligopeptide/nickel ABC transporter ATP-binding protein [Actinoplanes ferrugineus]
MTAPLLSVRGLTKDFQVGTVFSRRRVRAVNDVSFDLPAGLITALVGESGSGKSTIARCLARLEAPTAGQVLLNGKDVLRTERRGASRAYRRTVQMVFQDPFGSLNPVHRIEHFLTRALVLHGRSAAPEALRELLTSVGLTEDMLHSYPHELSGGQRQRVAIARALAVEPKLILADEPTSMLDVSVRVGVLNLMRRLRTDRDIAMLYITHDLGSARYLADTTMVMFAGEIVEGGDALAVMDAPAHPYTRLLLSAVPDPRRSSGYDPIERARLRDAILNPTACPYGSDGTCSRTEPVRHIVGEDQGHPHWVRCHLRAPATGIANRLLKATDDLKKAETTAA